MSADSNNFLNVWVPGRSHNNYLGSLEEDYPVTNLQKFGTHIKKQSEEELQVIYTCKNYVKLLSFKNLTSVIVYKNLKEITSLVVIQ